MASSRVLIWTIIGFLLSLDELLSEYLPSGAKSGKLTRLLDWRLHLAGVSPLTRNHCGHLLKSAPTLMQGSI